MFKTIIKNQNNVITNEKLTITIEESNLWVEEQSQINAFPNNFIVEVVDITEELQIEENEKQKLNEILELEKQITPRRVREALLSNDYTFIQSIENQIAALRD